MKKIKNFRIEELKSLLFPIEYLNRTRIDLLIILYIRERVIPLTISTVCKKKRGTSLEQYKNYLLQLKNELIKP